MLVIAKSFRWPLVREKLAAIGVAGLPRKECTQRFLWLKLSCGGCPLTGFNAPARGRGDLILQTRPTSSVAYC